VIAEPDHCDVDGIEPGPGQKRDFSPGEPMASQTDQYGQYRLFPDQPGAGFRFAEVRCASALESRMLRMMQGR
jgi:hypothetical protein